MDVGPVRFTKTDDGVSIAYRTFGRWNRKLLRVAAFVTDVEAGWLSDFYRPVLEGGDAVELGQVVYDQRGTGLSSRDVGEISAETMLCDLSAVVEAVNPEPLVLWAHGQAGPTAIRFVHEHPGIVDALILDGTFAYAGDMPGIEAQADLMKSNWPVAARMIADITAPDVDASVTEEMTKVMRASSDGQTAAKILLVGFSEDVRGLLKGVDLPTLVRHKLRQTNVRDAQSREMATEIPNAELSVVRWKNPIPITSEEADDYWGTIREFLDRNLPAGDAQPSSDIASGFRAILFTDVVASAPLLSQLKDEKMRAVMRDHDEVLEAAVTDNGGRVVKTIGDAFMAEFAVPSGAVEAAIAAQRGIRDKFADLDVPIRLRIGINAGEPIEEDGDLHGASVVIAKRLESEAENGGILVSDVVRLAVAGKEFEFVDRGEVNLKGFDEPVRAWSVTW